MKILVIFISSIFILNLSATIINIPADYPTIQEGINVTVDGDTVLVQPGIYIETINYNGKNIIVASLFYTTQDTSYISQTIIDGNNNERIVSFTNGETEEAKLIGLTIRNGYSYNNNQQNAGGVGIYILNSSPSIENNIIENNNSYWYVNGCGLGLQNSSAKIINNTIRNNNGGYYGGGIYVYQSENVIIENNVIYDHFTVSGYGADYGAGICLNQSNNIMIKKNLIYDNIVGAGGSGIAFKSSSGFIYGNTIFNNSNSEYGNNIFIDSYSTVEIKNSVLWSDDTNFGVEIADLGIVSVSYSNIKDSYDGIGNISRNPLFVDMINRDFHLTLQSPCINSGDPASEYDADGTIADMGYFHFDMSNYGSLSGLVTLEPGIGNIENVIVTIDSFTVSPFSDGYYIFNLLPGYYDITASLGLHYEQTITNIQVIQTEVTTGIDFHLENTDTNITIEINQDGTGDFTAIQEGINAAINGDTILVYPGVYFENINISEKSIILGSRFITTSDSTYISETIIDGNNYNSAISIVNLEDTTCVINGFTIRNGNAIINGGGIYCSHSSPKILNCYITGNYSDPNGGGIYCDFSNPIIENNNIYDNNALFNGGGIASYDSSPILINNKIHNNSTTHNNSRGGGLYFNHSSPIIMNCDISDNCSSSAGGAISFQYNEGDFTMINNVITGNSANSGGGIQIHSAANGVIINNLIAENNAIIGGGLYLQTTYISPYCPDIINCTIASNHSELRGGGIYFAEFSNSNIINSIIWRNEADEIGEQICLNSWYSDPNFYYSDIEEGLNGFGYSGTSSIEDYEGEYENNILLDPLFVEWEESNFHLMHNSPCINVGTPDTTGLNLPDYDLAGESRIYDGRIDMGCYEWQGTHINDEELQTTNWKLSNYPNPFNSSTTISFSISKKSDIELSVFNIKGQKIRTLTNNDFTKGSHLIIWNGDDEYNKPVSSGVYFYKLNLNGKTEAVKKCILMK